MGSARKNPQIVRSSMEYLKYGELSHIGALQNSRLCQTHTMHIIRGKQYAYFLNIFYLNIR